MRPLFFFVTVPALVHRLTQIRSALPDFSESAKRRRLAPSHPFHFLARLRFTTLPSLTLIMTFQFLSAELILEPHTVIALLERSNTLGNGTIQRYQPEVRALYGGESSARHGIQ